jgi:hypothetical protein
MFTLFASGLAERRSNMPTRQQVFNVADKLRAKPARVSLRSVRAELPRGGSYRDIGGHLAAWKSEREYQPRIELAQLPDFLQTDIASFGNAIWKAAMQEATRQFNADRERYEDLLKAERGLREEALMSADILEARVEALQVEVRNLRLEMALDRQEAAELR